MGRRRHPADLSCFARLEVNTVANTNLSSLLEAFAFATGVPPSVWRAVCVQGGTAVQSKPRTDNVKPRRDVEYWELKLLGDPEARSHAG